jgi:hypothetical protein
MKSHPYLRAFLAGTLVPTLVLPILLIAFVILRLGMKISFPIERGLVFPMALVPALWGAWSMLWQGTRERTHLPLGLHGACLPACSYWLRLQLHGSTRLRCRMG